MKKKFYIFIVVLTFQISLPQELSENDQEFEGIIKEDEKRGLFSDSAAMMKNFLFDSCDGLVKFDINRKSPNGDDPGDGIESMILKAGYNSKKYKVVTKDGYILSIFRVFKEDEPSKKTKGSPVILVHGLMGSVKDWVINDKEKALPYKLIENNKDVWLAANRGTSESRDHKELETDSSSFWSFSHVEYAKFDDPAFVEKVKEITGEDQVYWIGFALGNKQFFTWMALGPKNCSNIKAMWALAPQCYQYNTRSPLARSLSLLSKPAGLAIKLLGSHEFSGDNTWLNTAKSVFCAAAGSCPICDNVLMALGGFNKEQSNRPWQSILYKAVPAATSTQNFIHMGQDTFSDRLGYFDYGPWKNVVLYGITHVNTPPQLHPAIMKALPECFDKVNLMWSENDWMADTNDVEKLNNELGKVIKTNYKIDHPKWSHYDFLWGKDADKYVYDPLIQQMKVYDESSKPLEIEAN